MRHSYLTFLVIFFLVGCGAGDETSADAGSNVTEVGDRSAEISFSIDGATALLSLPYPDNSAVYLSMSETLSGSNLYAIDAQGNAQLALDADYPALVKYAAVDPAQENVYLVLDTTVGVNAPHPSIEDPTNPGENLLLPYSLAIHTGCAFWKVSLADGVASCAVEDMSIAEAYDPEAAERIKLSKPIQFNKDGNVFYLGHTFSTSCAFEDYDNDGFIEPDDGEPEAYCYVQYSFDHPRLYKYNPADDSNTLLTQDTDYIDFFHVLPTEGVAYRIDSAATDTSSLWFYQNGLSYKLSDSTAFHKFYLSDDHKSVFWDEHNVDYISSASLIDEGGVIKSLHSKPYGLVHELIKSKEKLISLNISYNHGLDRQELRFEQLLPFGSATLSGVFMDMANTDWLPIPISQTHLLYFEPGNLYTDDGSTFIDVSDLLYLVNLESGTTTTLFDNISVTTSDGSTTLASYDMHSWILEDNTLTFFALDKARSILVKGELDTNLVEMSLSDSSITKDQYLTLTDLSFPIDTSTIIDFESLLVSPSESDTGAELNATIYASESNLNNMSVAFNKPIDKTTIGNNITLRDENSTDIPYQQVWFDNTLHLVPDTSASGFFDDIAGPFQTGNHTYTLTIASTTVDIFGNYLNSGNADETANITTPYTNGWYAEDTSSTDTTLSSGKVARFAAPNGIRDYADLGVDITENLSIEFSVNNMGKGLRLYFSDDQYNPDINGNTTNLEIFPAGVVWYYTYSGTNYERAGAYDNGPAGTDIDWIRYKIDRIGSNLSVYYDLNDGNGWQTLKGLTITDLALRPTGGYLILGANNTLEIDNLTVTTLATDGSVATTTGDQINADFDTTSGLDLPGSSLDGISLESPDNDSFGFDDLWW